MRILASPKPPCPSFYFRKKNLHSDLGASVIASKCYISKRDLNPHSHIPQGRKFYLNHKISNAVADCKTGHPDENKNQKNRVNPLKPKCNFVFHIDFENLSNWELGLLLYALNPTKDFHHKIGMGKSLGLGTVKIEPAGLFFINRQERYSESDSGFDSGQGKRYHKCWVNNNFDITSTEVFGPYERDARNQITMDPEYLENIKQEFEADLPAPVRIAIEKIGKPDIPKVKPPLAEEQKDMERETFLWFQNNDTAPDTRRQGLIPLEYGDGIPTLKAN